MSAAMISPAHPNYDPLSLQWQRPPGLTLHTRHLGQSVALFNEESGDTHVFDPVAADVLAALDAPGLTMTTALAELVAPEADTGTAHERLAELLRTLHGLGLIEPLEA